MKISILLVLIFITAGIRANAQIADTTRIPADTTKYWKIVGKTSLNLSQVSLSNWAEGGVSQATGAFLFGINANNKKNRHIWDNAFNFEYGLAKNDGETARKTLDQIYLSSKYGYALKKPWFLSALFDFRSQISKGYNYPANYPANPARALISNLLAPGYIHAALGFDYKPVANLSLFISPISTRLTLVMDDTLSARGSFGVTPGDKFRAEFGAYLKFVYVQKSLVQNVDFETRLDLFSDYANNPQNVVVNWDIKFDAKINKFLQATCQATLKYDDKVKYVDSAGVIHGPRTQIREFLGIGLLYIF